MSFTVHPVLSATVDKHGTQKVYVRIIYDRKKIDFPTDVRITPDQLENEKVVKHKLKTLYNNVIAETKHRIEGDLIKLRGRAITKEELRRIVYGESDQEASTQNPAFADFIYDMCDQHEGRWADGFIRHGKTIANKIDTYQKGVPIRQITVDWLRNFEKHLREAGISHNTVHANMKRIKGFLKKACDADLIEEKQFKRYMAPVERRKIPTYLEEEEIEKFSKAVDVFQNPGHKVAGYYFLLACTAGFRISDAKKFDYKEMVQGNSIILRAKKNGAIISIPMYPRLQNIVDWVKDNPFNIAEQTGNDYLKDIAKFCGINKNLSFHVGRHTFAMTLMDKKFDLETVAELLGDSIQVASVYARISNRRVREEFREKFADAFDAEFKNQKSLGE